MRGLAMSRVETTENKTHCVGKQSQSVRWRQHGVAWRKRAMRGLASHE